MIGECRRLGNGNWTAMDKHLQIAEERGWFNSLVGRVVSMLGLKISSTLQKVTHLDLQPE
jgi:hypothetical protein